MNERAKRLRTRFAPETCFEVPTAARRTKETAELEELKKRLLLECLRGAVDDEQGVLLKRAANDAEALAWATRFPLLLFPVLFEEKAAAARRQARKQQQIRRRSAVMTFAA